MARGINKVILIGNMGADAEVRYTAGGTAVANLNIATTEAWTDRQSGERQERTEWHRLVSFGRQAEVIGELTTKGTRIYAEGRLQTRKWQDQDGNDRYTTEVVLREFEILSNGRDSNQNNGGQNNQGGNQNNGGQNNQGGNQNNGGQNNQGGNYNNGGHNNSGGNNQGNHGGAPNPADFDDFDDEIPF